MPHGLRSWCAALLAVTFCAAAAPAGAATHRVGAATHRVGAAAGLNQALARARPGTVIRLAAQVYADRDGFTIARDCTARRPCTLVGSKRSRLTTGGDRHAYGLHLTGDHWRLVGFTVTNAAKGIVVDDGDHDVIRGVTVSDIGDEGIHLRSGSSYDTVVGCLVQGTGTHQPGYGEGLYVGSAHSNWSKYGSRHGHGPDHSDHDRLLRNTVRHTGAESADIKEGTRGTVLRGNRFDGAGMSGDNYADSLVDLKGNLAVVTHNRGVHVPAGGAWTVHQVVHGWGVGNRIVDNTPRR